LLCAKTQQILGQSRAPAACAMAAAASQTASQKINALPLPPPPQPIGVYKPFARCNDMVYLSGHGPVLQDGSLVRGRIGGDGGLDLAAGYDAARQVGLAMLSTLRANFSPAELERLRVIKILGMVNAHDSFRRHPLVINGCSELFADIWGAEHGIGARSAVGMGTLPDNIPVEIEAIFHLPCAHTSAM
jgi:enamine deaminase RidA (YjgF/YER057c/UK114 family)